MISNLDEDKPGILLHNLGTFIYKKSALNTYIKRDLLPQMRRLKKTDPDAYKIFIEEKFKPA